MKNKYHVAYHFKAGGNNGMASMVLFMDETAFTEQGMKKIRNFLEDNLKNDFPHDKAGVVIVNVIKLEGETNE